MERSEKAYCRNLFKLKIYESTGQKFEDLFSAIMNYAYPSFESIKPWGSIGDRKDASALLQELITSNNLRCGGFKR